MNIMEIIKDNKGKLFTFGLISFGVGVAAFVSGMRGVQVGHIEVADCTDDPQDCADEVNPDYVMDEDQTAD